MEKPLGLEPIGLEPEGLGDLDLSDLPTDAGAGDSNACPGCGMPRAAGAVVCMSCGYNSQTGGKISTKVKKVREPKPGNEREQRVVSYGWVGILVMVGAAIGLPVIATTSEAGVVGALLVAGLWAIVAWIMMIAAAFRDGDAKWGIIGLCNLIPCIGAIPGLLFAFYYCIFGSERTGWKLNYWCSVVAMLAIYAVIFAQYPELVEEYAQSP